MIMLRGTKWEHPCVIMLLVPPAAGLDSPAGDSADAAAVAGWLLPAGWRGGLPATGAATAMRAQLAALHDLDALPARRALGHKRRAVACCHDPSTNAATASAAAR